MKIPDLFNDFLNLFFPQYCLGCETLLVKGEHFICTRCKIELPRTGFQTNPSNPVAQLLWGRALIENATSYFYFQKGNRLQHIIHHIKYKGEKEAGYELGYAFGLELTETPFIDIDFILPVPLTRERLKKRGYNQSEWIANGIAEAIKRPVKKNVLYRTSSDGSQTHKNRFERWESVEENFAVENVSSIINKHVLLVDDVITTGATLEASANALLKIPGCKVSIATLAFAV